jgi:hypothetical protein
MRPYLAICFLFIASTALSQPVIDSLSIDELKGELYLHGSFGFVLGKVTIDNVELKVKNWADSLIITQIGDSGKGAFGPVIVSTGGLHSNVRMISLWHERAVNFSSRWHSCGGWESDSTVDNIFFRCDLYSVFHSTTHQISSMLNSSTSETHLFFERPPCLPKDTLEIHNYGTEPLFSTITFNLEKRQIIIDLVAGGGIFLDSMLNIIAGSAAINCMSPDICEQDWSSAKITFPPPMKELFETPSLVFPESGTLFSYRNNVVLRWDSLLNVSYILQVAIDSSFKNRIVDTTVSSNFFALDPLQRLTQYYWRIAIKSSDGTSRWSDVWNFWSGGGLKKVDYDSLSHFSLSCNPNPSQNEITLEYTSPEEESGQLVLYDLAGKIIYKQYLEVQTGNHQLYWNTSQISSGTYILGFSSNKDTQTKIIIIKH